MKLLVVTDHRYHQDAVGVWDTYCFDRHFFNDYRSVFDEVRVAARIQNGAVPEGAKRSDGDGVSFVALTDLQGGRWALAPRRLTCGALVEAVRWADAVCVRIPSVSGTFAYQLAEQQRKPVMFELIGDPWMAVQGSGFGLAARVFGLVQVVRVRQVAQGAICGSYVSYHHLQKRYPPGPETVIEPISSIRLAESDVLSARRYAAAQPPLTLILVASLVPVKDHSTLLTAVSLATSQGYDLRLHLLGDGPERPRLEKLAADLSLTDRVEFHGHVSSRAAINEWVDQSDLFVMTSISEGMPRSMIECMARGLPAIGTETGGIAEILPAPQRFPVGDARRCSELLMAVIENPTLLDAFAVHSERVARQFTETVLSARRQSLLRALRDAVRRRR